MWQVSSFKTLDSAAVRHRSFGQNNGHHISQHDSPSPYIPFDPLRIQAISGTRTAETGYMRNTPIQKMVALKSLDMQVYECPAGQ